MTVFVNCFMCNENVLMTEGVLTHSLVILRTLIPDAHLHTRTYIDRNKETLSIKVEDIQISNNTWAGSRRVGGPGFQKPPPPSLQIYMYLFFSRRDQEYPL